MNMNQAHISDYIDRIYQAVLTPEDIPTIMDDLRTLVDAPYSSFQVEGIHNHSLDQMHLVNYDPTSINSYSDYFVSRDPWTQTIINRGMINTPFQCSERLVSDKDYCRSEFYQDWGRHWGVRYAMGSGFQIDQQHILKLAFQRHCDHTPFTVAEEQTLNLLHGHFEQWVRLHGIFSDQQQEISSSLPLDSINRPVWVLDRNMALHYSNHHGQQQLSDNKVFSLSNNQLRLKVHHQHTQLEKRIQLLTHSDHLLQHAIQREPVFLTIDQQTETFWLIPFTQHNQRRVILVGQKVIADEQDIESQLGITRRQAQAAMLLTKGHNLADIAQNMNISVHTVRNQLSSCYRELNVANQSELIELVSHTWKGVPYPD